jgi:hypothetical protein
MKKKLFMVFLCIAGALLNIAFNKIAGVTVLPLYVDTILTISLTLTGGLFWGALCGFLTNIITHTINLSPWEVYLFTLCNIATAYITWLFIRYFPRELKPGFIPSETAPASRRWGKGIDKIIVLTLLSFALCIAMSIMGGMITAFTELVSFYALRPEINPSSVVLRPIMFPGGGPPLIITEILSRIPINIADRLISVFAGYGIALMLCKIPVLNKPA